MLTAAPSLDKPAFGHPVVAGEVRVDGDVMVMLRLEEAAQGEVLVATVFEQQPALADDVVVRAVQYVAEAIHARRTCIESQARLEACVAPAQMWIVLGHVGRIADDDIEFLTTHRIEPVALPEFDILELL